MTTDNGIVQWYNGKVDLESTEQNTVWFKYRDIEMEILETSYQQKQSEVFLDRYRIDMKTFTQYNRTDPTIQFPVKRQPNCRREECLREWRFSTPPPLGAIRSYGAAQAWCPFLRAWLETVAGKQALLDFSSAIDSCANGILQEAVISRSDSQAEANWMIQQLRKYKTKPRPEISEFCIHLYTRESFLYRALNQALRDSDHSKLDTLGPLCFLIRSYTHGNNGFVGTVYRGVDLKPEMIASYKQAKGLSRTWPSFISTSKSRKLAEVYGNTLFIITIVNIKYCSPVHAYDVSNISQFPEEEEVLLPAGITFRVIKVEENPDGKNLIEIEV